VTDRSGRRVAVVGAGLSGSLLAIYLGRAGYEVEVHESRSDPRARGYRGGRSINLAISTRGLHALERAGLRDRILETAVPMRGRMVHGPRGELSFQPYGRSGQAINSVSRGELNLALIEAADALPGVTFRFDRKCAGVDPRAPSVEFRDTDDGPTSVAGADIVVGADGAFSAVRRSLQRIDRFDFSQSWLKHGYKELTIPAGEDGGHRMEPNALHIWPRGGYMMIALPNRDGSFTCTLFWPFEGENSFARLTDASDVLEFFRANFPDAVDLMPTLVDDYFSNPTASLVTIRCFPWRYEGKVALVGDACHAVVPFYGQGANAAFESCEALADALAARASSPEEALRAYESARKEDVDALADLAIGNFLEMRDRVASSAFLMKKRLEKGLHRVVPSLYLPLYSMVTFSRIPYAETVRRHRRQVRRLAWILGATLVIAAMVAGFLLASSGG
jgi:kynurenine 3-monooxygenase